MIGPFFVDTDVLVRSLDAREPDKQARVRGWLEYLWLERLGRTSTQVLGEYYGILTRKLRPSLPLEQARAAVGNLFAWNPRAIDRELIERAWTVETHYRLSPPDSLIVAAAQLETCPVLLSEGLQHGCVYGTVTVLNPVTTEVTEVRDTGPPAAAPYRRRGRGRPRKSG